MWATCEGCGEHIVTAAAAAAVTACPAKHSNTSETDHNHL